jgi:rubrerythrin
MSRQADREGFPEIAEAFRRFANDEAEHAARFAELLGETLTASTEENLKIRAEAERGAAQGKKDFAAKAKSFNLDAVANAVNEMSKDEARHEKGFEGLLKRYF